jgi:hypothetical protein
VSAVAMITVAFEAERDQAEALLRFLRRVDTRTIEFVLNGADKEVECFEAAAKRLRVALATSTRRGVVSRAVG